MEKKDKIQELEAEIGCLYLEADKLATRRNEIARQINDKANELEKLKKE